MKYIRQFAIILAFAFAGELLRYVLPLPVPAGIYGIVLLFLALELHLVPLAWVEDVGQFFLGIMPILFIPSTVGIMTVWGVVQDVWWQYVLICIVTTIIVMAVAGRVTQGVLLRGAPQLAEANTSARDAAQLAEDNSSAADPVLPHQEGGDA